MCLCTLFLNTPLTLGVLSVTIAVMRSQYHISGLCLLCALPLVVGEVAVAEPAVDVCRQLVQESREVDRLLRTVSDRESGAAVAADLRGRMEYLRKATEELGRLPVGSAEEARALEQMMRDLTHITQGYMQVVQLLREVNAYGADELISLFQYYKMGASDSVTSELQSETLLVRAYTEWCDAIDDVLYALRRVQSAETAAAVAGELSALVRKMESKAAMAESLQQGLSPQQIEAERVPMERLKRIRDEFRSESQRIRSAQYFGSDLVRDGLEACQRALRS